MRNKTWMLLTIFLVMGSLALAGCSSRDTRTPDMTPNQTRTIPGPTRVTPPVTPTPSQTRTVPGPTNITPSTTPSETRTPGTTNMPGTSGTPRTSTMPRTIGNKTAPGTPGTPGTIRKSTTSDNTENRASQIAKDIAKEKDIQSASCVVTGNTALVGLQFEKQYKGDVTDTIKKSVEKRVKDHEPTIKKVVVTADPDLLSRIKTMATDIEKGKPLSGFTTEVEEILRRINPF